MGIKRSGGNKALRYHFSFLHIYSERNIKSMYTTQARHCDNVICTKYTRDATTANTVQCLYLRARARACVVCVSVWFVKAELFRHLSWVSVIIKTYTLHRAELSEYFATFHFAKSITFTVRWTGLDLLLLNKCVDCRTAPRKPSSCSRCGSRPPCHRTGLWCRCRIRTPWSPPRTCRERGRHSRRSCGRRDEPRIPPKPRSHHQGAGRTWSWRERRAWCQEWKIRTRTRLKKKVRKIEWFF